MGKSRYGRRRAKKSLIAGNFPPPRASCRPDAAPAGIDRYTRLCIALTPDGGLDMDRKKASDFPQELLDQFDLYVHGGDQPPPISRPRRANSRSAASRRLLCSRCSSRITPGRYKSSRTIHASSPKPSPCRRRRATATSRDIWSARPTHEKLPAVLVIHENRGLNPYIEDVARRLAVANFIAFAPDGADLARRLSRRRRKGAGAVRQARPRQDDRGFCRGGDNG